MGSHILCTSRALMGPCAADGVMHDMLKPTQARGSLGKKPFVIETC